MREDANKLPITSSSRSTNGALQLQGQYLWDREGRRFLDTRNNVGHVGWQHAGVVSAVQRQTALTNANSR